MTISFRILTTVASLALIFSIGSSATATTNYSHPQFSVTEDRALSLRETGSQIVIDTIENAFRVAGVEVFGGGFQLDSSIGYDLGDVEGIRGEVDAVIPLLHYGKHVLFAQPGAVFWTGIEKEERIDGNFGLVYRTELTRDLIGGVSFFYDQDFQIGHSRAGGGIDLQSGSLLLGANYYHVLSEVEDGREGFIEEAVDGMDLRLAIEKEIVRAEASIGYWDYTGEESGGQEDPQSGWQTSMGIDFGVRVMPGVFVEAGWEKHKDDLVLDERIFAGLAFRFSLPDLKGASYGDGSMSANLYKIVDREKRILYEEREADNIILTPSGTVEEGGTVTVAIQLREPSAEDVVINLVGSGTATYGEIGDDGDWLLNNGSGNCSAVTGTSCQITITAGETVPSDNAVITINDDGGGEDPETIILSTTIASGDASLTSRPLVLTIPVDPPLPTVSLSADSTSILEGNTATITLTLSEGLGSDATFNLIAGGTEATYGTGANDDWNLSVGGTDCDMASGTMCQVTIDEGDTTAEVTVEINRDTTAEAREDFTVSVVVDSGSTSIVQEGSSSSLNFHIPLQLPTVSLNYSGSNSVATSAGIAARLTVELSEALTVPVTLYLVASGTAAYDTVSGSTGWSIARRAVPPGENSYAGNLNFDFANSACVPATGTSCPITFPIGGTVVDVQISILNASAQETAIVEVVIPQASQSLVEAAPGDDLTETFTVQ
ncbi:MAG: inverse autotransporter beta domain-containing protein [Hyphomicrobiales bacterium]|nr:inverse autotransporter beta domain-containing protein [Hyphomicrobiales bacterium]